jgi:hypothetical protein
MEDGKIVKSGRYKDRIACPYSEFVQQMAAHEETICQIPCRKDESVCCRPCQKNPIEIAEENIQEIMMDWKRTREEESMTGRVKWSVYSTFVTLAYRGALVPVILLCQVLFQVMQIGSNYWMSWATEQKGMADTRQCTAYGNICSFVWWQLDLHTRKDCFNGNSCHGDCSTPFSWNDHVSFQSACFIF